MKKIIALILAAMMLASMLVITANAKDPYGMVIEVPYSTTAPSMEADSPDASWGEPIVHVDKNTENAGFTQYKHPDKDVPDVKRELSFDLYAMWTDTALYLCFVSPDDDMVGGPTWFSGDVFQLVVYPGICDVSYCNGVSTGWTTMNQYYDCDWTAALDIDDVSTSCTPGKEDYCVAYADIRNNQFVAKFEMPYNVIGFGKKDVIGDGTCISFSMTRGECTQQSSYGLEDGYLEWGDFYNGKKGWATTDSTLYLPWVENSKTKTANTFKLVNKSAGSAPQNELPEDDTPATPVTPTTPAEEPSSWAKDEVNKAIAAGLVPDALQKDYTKGISRENLSKILSALLDKVYGKAPATTTAKFNDTTDADVLKAANLGIINGYKADDGSFNFKPSNTLKRSEMSAIVNRVAKLCGKTTTGFDSEVKFADTANHWCKSELGWPVHVGIVKGTSDTTFSPENTLTTEQTIMMIYRAYEALK